MIKENYIKRRIKSCGGKLCKLEFYYLEVIMIRKATVNDAEQLSVLNDDFMAKVKQGQLYGCRDKGKKYYIRRN